MSSDYQSGRVALGARMRELRTEAGLNGKDFAERLGWQRSMVSRLENGKQTPSRDDLAAWAEAAGRADVIAELAGRLAGLETRYRSLRKEYSNGHRARQEQGLVETEQTKLLRAVEVIRIPGLFQTPEYARAVFTANAAFRDVPAADIEDAVRARMRRQQALYELSAPSASCCGKAPCTRSTRHGLSWPRSWTGSAPWSAWTRCNSASSPSPPSCAAAPHTGSGSTTADL